MSVIIHSYTQALSKVILSAVDLTSSTVDYYLPPSEEEIAAQEKNPIEGSASSEQQTTDDIETIRNVIRKVGNLSTKMRLRVTRVASSKCQSLQQRGHEALVNAKSIFDLVKHAKVLEDLSRLSLDTVTTHPTKTLAKLAVASINLADQTVEYYLPPSDEEIAKHDKQEQENGDSIPDQEPVDAETVRNVIRKAGNLSEKVRLRVTQRASSRLHSIQQLGYDTFEKVRNNRTLIEYAKLFEESVRSSLSFLPSLASETLSKMALSAYDFAEHYLPHSEEKEKEKEKQKDC